MLRNKCGEPSLHGIMIKAHKGGKLGQMQEERRPENGIRHTRLPHGKEIHDRTQDTDRFYVVNVKAATQGGTLLSAVKAPFSAATNIRVRVEFDTSGNTHYYFNGKDVGYKASATTAATALVPYFGIKNLNASAHVATVRRVRLWEDE